jgi:sensor histidine kinase YesM
MDTVALPIVHLEDTMLQATIILIDLLFISLLTFGMYFPRHRRRDLVVAYLVVNVGVLAVAQVLATSDVGLGLGLGLFGVLSIIRLRSSEIEQHEVAYYFAALAMGLLAGLSTAPTVLTVALMALIIVVVYFGDNPRLFRTYRQQTVALDAAFADEPALITHLEELLGARVHGVNVRRLDLVNDTTVVDVRYQIGAPRSLPKAPTGTPDAMYGSSVLQETAR